MNFKQIITLVMITAFAMQTFSRYVIMADYNMNTQAYAKNCINKAKPKMQCSGKCQMMKKIQEEEKKEKENTEKKSSETINNLSSKSFFITTTFHTNNCIKKQYPSLQTAKETKRSFEIFHPPSC